MFTWIQLKYFLINVRQRVESMSFFEQNFADLLKKQIEFLLLFYTEKSLQPKRKFF